MPATFSSPHRHKSETSRKRLAIGCGVPFDRDTLAFIGVALVVVVTPGPDMVLVTTHALASGRGAARMAALGVCTGILVHATAAVIGLSALLSTSSMAFTVVKLAGALVLIALGLRTIMVRRPRASTARTWVRLGSSPFWQGFWSNVLNPKVALLFLSLLPQFVDQDHAPVVHTLSLSAAFLTMGIAWLLVYVEVVSRAATFLRRDRVRRPIEVVSGAVLVALGLKVATVDA